MTDSTIHPEVLQDDDELPEVRNKMRIEASSWRGPLPPPSALQSYEEVLEGSADRILKMAEKQTEHRISMESMTLKGRFTRSYWGLAAGFVLSAMVIGGGIYVISRGHDWAGGILISASLVGLASVFVLGRNSRRVPHRELIERMTENNELDNEQAAAP